jgi:hypothetical protein
LRDFEAVFAVSEQAGRNEPGAEFLGFAEHGGIRDREGLGDVFGR